MHKRRYQVIKTCRELFGSKAEVVDLTRANPVKN
jgi:hypothetical protein